MNNELNARPMDLPQPEQQENSWAFLLFAWRRKWIVMFVTAIGVGLGYLYFLRQTPVFQSGTQVLIVKRHTNLPVEALQINTGFDSTHEALLRSPLIIGRALSLKGNNISQLQSLRESPNPVAAIMSGLTVSRHANNGVTGDVIQIAYSGTNAEDCGKIVDAIVDAYEEFITDTYRDVSENVVDLIKKAKDTLDFEITKTQSEYQSFREKSSLMFTGDTVASKHEVMMPKIQQNQAELQLEITVLQSKIESIRGALQRGASREALNLMVTREREAIGNQMVNTAGGGNRSIEEQLFPLMIEEQMLLDTYGKDHPKVQQAKKKTELTRKHLLGMVAQAEEKEKSREKEPQTRDFYQVYLESLTEQVRERQQRIASLTKMFEEEQSADKMLTNQHIENEHFKTQLELKQKLFLQVVNRLEEINLMQSSGGVTFERLQKGAVGVQIKPDMKQILTTSGMLALVVGLALAFAVDSADRRFRSPDEIRTILRTPVIGHIPVIQEAVGLRRSRKDKTPAENGLAESLRTYHHPRGRISEAYRAIRTALYFSTRGSGHQVIQVTSPSPGDGKSTSAANLAVSIAQSGKSVLIIDADFRRPRCHTIFGVGNDVGMSSAIDGSVELSDAIQATSIENLSVLPCGPKPSNPAELLSSKRFEDLVNVLREKYEIVIIDSPPVLAVTDPLNVAPRVDGVLLVLRLTKSARSAGMRALDALDALGANVLGVVVNGVGETQGYGGYSYGGYGRGYAYNYNYGGYGEYGYRYGYGERKYDDENSYYIEDEDGIAKVATPSIPNGAPKRDS